VKQWGIPYETKAASDALTGAVLAARCEPALKMGVVANGVRFITAAADVQNNRFELLYRGWGERGESWIVDRTVVKADTAVSPADWDGMLELLLERRFPLDDDSGRTMGVRAAGYDSGGAPGVTAQAYDAWRRWRLKRKIKRYGLVDGRDAWSLLPMKGQGSITAPRLNVVYPDSERKDRRVNAGGTVPVGQFSANQFKDDLGGQLAITTSGAWAIHFPMSLQSQVPPHVFFEQLVAEQRKLNGTWEKITPGAKNEALDLMVMTHALAHLMGLARMNWDSPPSWAAPWDQNIMVRPPETPVETLAAGLRAVAAAVAPVAPAPAFTPPARPGDDAPAAKPNRARKLA